MMIIGILGAILLAVSWLPETYETIKNKRCDANLEFLLIYVIAAILLTTYSIQIKDVVFMSLNGFVVIESFINLGYKIKYN